MATSKTTEHFAKYWWAYLLGLATIVITAFNWKNWFGETTVLGGTGGTSENIGRQGDTTNNLPQISQTPINATRLSGGAPSLKLFSDQIQPSAQDIADLYCRALRNYKLYPNDYCSPFDINFYKNLLSVYYIGLVGCPDIIADQIGHASWHTLPENLINNDDFNYNVSRAICALRQALNTGVICNARTLDAGDISALKFILNKAIGVLSVNGYEEKNCSFVKKIIPNKPLNTTVSAY